MRGIGGRIIPSYLPQERVSKVPLETNFHVYATKKEEMTQTLAMRGIEIPNFAYDFSILEGPHRLSDTSDKSFLLPFHVLEAGFYLPLNRLFYHLLQDHRIVLGQLSGFSWWLVVAYFINCYQCNKVPLFVVF